MFPAALAFCFAFALIAQHVFVAGGVDVCAGARDQVPCVFRSRDAVTGACAAHSFVILLDYFVFFGCIPLTGLRQFI
jgi:hypothetical protein